MSNSTFSRIVLPLPRPRATWRVRRLASDEDFVAARQFSADLKFQSRLSWMLAAIVEDHEATPPQIELSGLYAVEDIGSGRWVAAAASVFHCDGRFNELCGATVRERGYGLLDMLVLVRAVRARMSTNTPSICLVPDGNTALAAKLMALGFDAWTTLPEALVASLGTRLSGHTVFLLQQVHNALVQLAHINQSGTVAHKTTREQVSIAFDVYPLSCPRGRAALLAEIAQQA
jgi:hypothetical protein